MSQIFFCKAQIVLIFFLNKIDNVFEKYFLFKKHLGLVLNEVFFHNKVFDPFAQSRRLRK